MGMHGRYLSCGYKKMALKYESKRIRIEVIFTDLLPKYIR
jgi:hypothetical protein